MTAGDEMGLSRRAQIDAERIRRASPSDVVSVFVPRGWRLSEWLEFVMRYAPPVDPVEEKT